jgi:ribokinase
MMTPPRIAVVGSANTDLITFADRFPRAGETLFGQGFDLGFGGKGANQAVAARLSRAEVLMIAKVGQGIFGEATIRNLNGYGIDTKHVGVVKGAPPALRPYSSNRTGRIASLW